jgi:hypothetical protein
MQHMKEAYAAKWHFIRCPAGLRSGFFADRRNQKEKRVKRIYQWNEGYGKDQTALSDTQGHTRPFLMA